MKEPLWYGRVFKSHLFGCPTIVSCDLELNTFILRNEGRLFESSYSKPVLDILGKLSIMLFSGDLYKKLRNIAVSFISMSRSRPDFFCYVEKLSVLVMESGREHQEVSFYEEAKKVRSLQPILEF
ncbi:Cytochrome P450 724B1 [Camellia lanceoleosa]|uniref:Cytochrome P450 724B1 n=1 Tax=Camellia lanceoleosa TaxID=1840588 RepID=A0ACC0G4U1_9ERIC|nr:Cytochrome P450 724B1 [Camellia lanceoleosa]